MLIRLSFLVVASVTALSVSHIKNASHVKKNKKLTSPGSDDSQFQFESGEKESSISNTDHASEEEEEESKTPVQQNVAEMELLQNLVKSYKQRKSNLERKLLELNSMKEEKSIFAQLRWKIDEETSKLDLLNMTIDSLRAENKVLQEKLKEGVLAEKQLEIATKTVDGLQRKNDVNESPAKKQILILEKQLTEFTKYESSGGNDMVAKKLKDLENLELEVLTLKRENKELQLEKRQVGIKLATAEETTKKKEKMVAKIRNEITGSRRVNEELSEQVERLQRNRFDMVHELVYQRWLSTCMRFEAYKHHKQSRKASREDFNQNSEKVLCKEIEASTSDPELHSISSSNPTFSESDKIDTTAASESSSSSQGSINKNPSLLHRFKRWKRRKDDSKAISPKGLFLRGNFTSRPSPIYRFSLSMVLENLSMPRKNSDNGNSEIKTTQETNKQNYYPKSSASPVTPRLKRVSLDDSIKPSMYVYMPDSSSSSSFDPSDDNETMADIGSSLDMELTSSTTCYNEHEAEQYQKPSSSDECAGDDHNNNDTIPENKGSMIELSCNKAFTGNKGSTIDLSYNNAFTRSDKIRVQVGQLVTFFFFFFLFLMVIGIFLS